MGVGVGLDVAEEAAVGLEEQDEEEVDLVVLEEADEDVDDMFREKMSQQQISPQLPHLSMSQSLLR